MKRPSPSNVERAPRRGLHALGALAALLCLFGQLSGTAHLLLVRHITCPEHGELIHADELGAESSVFASLEAPRGAPTLKARPVDLARHGHDHCFVHSHRREGQIPAFYERTLFAVPVSAPFGQPRVDVPRAHPFGLYRLAPKASPPAA